MTEVEAMILGRPTDELLPMVVNACSLPATKVALEPDRTAHVTLCSLVSISPSCLVHL